MDYGKDFNRLANVDIIFVLDASSSIYFLQPDKDDQNATHQFLELFDERYYLVHDVQNATDDTTQRQDADNPSLVGFNGAFILQFTATSVDLQMIQNW